MRLKISLKSKNSLFIPFNYNHIISSIVYSKIADLDLASKLHSSKTFKFFTFSQLNIKQRKIVKEGIISKNGEFDFQISSPNDHLIKSLVEGYLDDLTVSFKGEKLFVEKVELLANPKFENEANVKTISPIIARIKKEVDGKLKPWDLSPGDQKFYTNLENNLIKKYNDFYSKEIKIGDIKISSDMKFVKRKRITIEKGDMKTFHRAFMMDLNLEGDKELIKFAYDCGLGEKNSMGFGMIRK
ncbi:CRISPR-associated endoribonuclease Cas6 [Methanobrevibacter curvatus]|uniref:CRISPR-associated endoribonuclease n=1 Tax=Methanobrevibacter curvatus TaxID=49547 RepID=A0A162FEV9_9EURY|nr:CRISPR-associated endoribonuclease Cas6 [Methanobrevibacter curvatus]KZX12045.1 CRISPR associated protein Cas6 [Methanobrevibacter curvatus]